MRFYFLFILLHLSTSAIAQSNSGDKAYDHHVGLFVWVNKGIVWEETQFQNRLRSQVKAAPLVTFTRPFITNEEPLNRILIVENFDEKDREVIKAFISKWEEIALVEDVPEYYLYHTPNDLQSQQWNLKKVQAELAWDLGVGSADILVALVDDGLDTLHSDLQPLLWHNTDENPKNGLDDDLNGYVDDYYGWDMADNDNDPCVKASDGLNHGTHCAGIIGACTNNNNGIAGLGYNLKIMPLKTGKKGARSLFKPYEGVEYAARNGAQVISMSWGGGGYSATYQAIFDFAFKKNVICIAAAGNNNNNVVHYPAGYDHVFAVGATDSTDRRSSFSSYGTYVDVMAPGTAIYSTLPNNQYGYMSGTSMACPLVSGLAALMLARNPFQTNLEVEACIISGCENINAKNSAYIGQIGAGRINAYQSMKCIKMVRAKFGSSKVFVCTGDTVQFLDQSYRFPTYWRWLFQGGSPSNSSVQNPVVRYSTSGTYLVQLIVGDGINFDTLKVNAYITVGKPTAKFSGKQTILKGDYGTIKVDFTGPGPWDLVYTDGKKNYTQTNITSNPHYILVPGDTTRTYKPVSVAQLGCSGSVSDSAKITVYTKYSFLCDSAYRFQQRFGGSDDDQCYRVVVYDDTTLLLAGKTRSYGTGHFGAFVAKISTNGKMIWFKTFGGSNEDVFYTLSVDENKDIYVGGFTFSNVSTKAVFFMKLAKDGSILWKKHYNGSSLEYIRHSIVSRDKKHIFFAGPSISSSLGAEDFTVYKVDTTGTVIWAKQVGNSGFNRNDAIWEDTSGNLYTCGTQGVPHPALDGALAKLDKNGDVLWAKGYGNSSTAYQEGFVGLVPWKNKALFLYGYANGSSTSEVWVVRTNMNGVAAWGKRYTMGTTSAASIVIKDDELYISGATSNGGGDGFFIKLDTNGNVLQSQAIGGTASESILETINSKDGGFYYTGFDATGGNNQFWVGKTNCAMSSLCNNKSLTVTVNSITLSTTTLSYSSQAFNVGATATVGVSNNTPTVGFICRNMPPDSSTKTECNLDADMQIIPNCTGSDVQFKDVSVDNAGYVISQWFWDFGDGSKASGSKNVLHKYKSDGVYTVQLIVRSVKGSFYCLDTVSYDYQSIDSFRINKMLLDTTICFRDSKRFGKIITSCGEAPYFYFWEPADGVSDRTSAEPAFSPLKTTTYKVNITDFKGKTATDSFTVFVNPECCRSFARFEIQDGYACDKDSVRFVNTSIHKKNAVFQWSFEGTSISSYNGFTPPALVFNSIGLHKVGLILSDSCSDDTFEMSIYVNPLPEVNAGNDTLLCMPDTLRIGQPAFDWYGYEWTPAAGLSSNLVADPIATVTKPITYRLVVTSDQGCVASDSIKITRLSADLELGNDTTICEGDSLTLETKVSSGKYLWNTGATGPLIRVGKAGMYWLQLQVKGCIFRDSIVITTDSIPSFELPHDTSICETQFPLLVVATKVKVLSASSTWDNASTGLQRSITAAGSYWLERRTNLCFYRDTIVVNSDIQPTVDLGPDTSLCETGGSILLSPVNNPGAVSYLWDNGTIVKDRTVTQSGNYWLQVISGKCRDADTVNVQIDSVPTFDLGTDTLLCSNRMPFQIVPKNVRVPGAGHLWNDNSTNKTKTVQLPGVYTLIMNNGNCSFWDSIRIDTLQKPWVILPADTTICAGDTLHLQTPLFPLTSYQWNNGITEPKLDVIKGGKYLVQLLNRCGSATDEIQVEDKDCSCPIYIPNSFSPGRSINLNDRFSVVLDCPVDRFEIDIYNRWGNLVYHSKDVNFSWDGYVKGERTMNGAYYCIVRATSKYENGGREFMRTGFIYILE